MAHAKWKIFVVVLLTSAPLIGCAQSAPKRPTPAEAKQFLKLRGYEFNEKAFASAAAANDAIAVDGFLAAGMNPNVKDEESGMPLLVYSAWHQNEAIVKVLLKGGADPNAKDFGGYTALLRALEKKNDAIADLLLAQPKVDLNAQGASGMTAMMWYVWSQQNDKVQNLLARGANPNLPDADGDTPLHGAAQRGNLKLLEMLLAAGAEPNAKNKLGGTALMWAAVYGHQLAARLLIEKGADPAMKDESGMTAAAWAVKNQRPDMAQMLRDAEQKR